MGNEPYHVDVLLSKGHYFLIRNLATLVSTDKGELLQVLYLPFKFGLVCIRA